jgi:ribonucleoside-diphosphate reductase alpha chain
MTCLAIAPTMSNSIISGGMSAGIEPLTANCYSLKSAKGTFIRKNQQLVQLLESKGVNTVETWGEIIKASGSVQSLKVLSAEEKDIFKTAREINQFAIVNQAAQRQKFIDQGISTNLFFTAGTSAKYVHEVHLEAWKLGMKSLYYLRSESVLKGTAIEYDKSECASCEG